MKKMIAAAMSAALAVSMISGMAYAEEATEAATEAAAENPDAYKDEDMSAYKVDGMSIGVSFGQNVHPFFKAMQKGIEDACTDYGIEKTSIQSADSSLEKQVTQIENLTTSGITSLLVNPYDSEGVSVAVQDAINAGVNVFSMDISISGAEPTYHVASDNKKIGELLAQRLDEELGGEGKIAILVEPSVSSLKDRQEGFENYIKDNTNIEIVAEQLHVEEAEVKPETDFKADLRADSLDLFELVMALEEEYDVEIPTEDLEKLTTVQAVLDYLKQKGIEEA